MYIKFLKRITIKFLNLFHYVQLNPGRCVKSIGHNELY